MKNFWPNRSKAKGFLIENFARRYRKKISNTSFDKTSNQFLVESNFKSRNEESDHISMSHVSLSRSHWANRDFSEYREAA